MLKKLAGFVGVGGYASYCYKQSGWKQVLERMSEHGQETFLFVSREEGDTCERCAWLDGKGFTLDGLEGQELPPLHPNCGCAIMPMPSAPPPGSIGAGEADEGAWRGVMRNLLDIPPDAWGMLEGFFNAQYERFADGHYLDWLTLGIFSGYWNAGMERTQTMMESPGMYSVLNWLTSGFPDIAKGAADPEKPLSLEHWMDSIGVASAVYGVLEVSKQGAARAKPAKTPVADANGAVSQESGKTAKSQRERYPHWYNIDGSYTGGRTQKALDALAFDPHKGKITSGSITERDVILALEEQGYLEYAIRDTWGKGDFFDEITLKLYDIKSFESYPLDNLGNPITSVNGGAFDVTKSMRNIIKEFDKNGVNFVIINTTKMASLHISLLNQQIKLEGLSDYILWY